MGDDHTRDHIDKANFAKRLTTLLLDITDTLPAAFLISSFNSPNTVGNDLSKLQKQPILRLEIAYDLGNGSDAADVEAFEFYFSLFDEIFFFGSLKVYCKQILQAPNPKDTLRRHIKTGMMYLPVTRNTKILGSASTLRATSTKDSVIVIYTQEGETRHQRLKACTEMLMHEMIHAFICL
jgi:hypothetical protein